MGGLNLFAYVENDPINSFDPEGLTIIITADLDKQVKYQFAPRFRKPRKEKNWESCWANCVNDNQIDFNKIIAPMLGSAYPKRIIPPFRVPNPKDPLTTIPSTIQLYLSKLGVSENIIEKLQLRNLGRKVSPISTPLLLTEVFYNWGVIINCADICNRGKECILDIHNGT